ncbi:MAG: ATP-binding cassette domain-containing protein [Chitinophagales bacterium]
MIEIKDIKKSFGPQQVLKGISAVFEAGKCNLIIGKSGSGKTVTLKTMVGLIEPDSGEVLYDGRDFTKMDFHERKLIRREIGMLFQGSALFDSMSVEENIRFPLDMFTDKTAAEKRDRVNECLAQVNMVNTNKKYPGELSGGMKKRVGIARAIVLNPRYLFCDEPNSGLDPKTSLVIDDLIKEITMEYKMTTVINTHDMNSVMGIGDKVVFLHEGLKYWEGPSSEIMNINDGELFDFIFASDFLKDLRKAANR